MFSNYERSFWVYCFYGYGPRIVGLPGLCHDVQRSPNSCRHLCTSHISYVSLKHSQLIACSRARHRGEQSLLQRAYKPQKVVEQVADSKETCRVRNTFSALTVILSYTALSVSLWEPTAVSFMWAD